MVKNQVPELDMDIILDSAPDTINTQAEQFQLLVQLAGSRPEVPFSAILEMSALRDKDELLETIKQREAAMLQQSQQAMAMQAQAMQSKEQRENAIAGAQVSKSAAETGKINMQAINQQLENLLITANPGSVTSIST